MTSLPAAVSSEQKRDDLNSSRRSKYVERTPSRFRGKRFIPLKNSVTVKEQLKNVEKDYRYNNERDLSDYLEKFGEHFVLYSESLKLIPNVTVLDSGAGKGIAMQNLIVRTQSIALCTCVTKHRFDEADLLSPIKDKMKWVYGRSEDYLAASPDKYDLITDLFGAYNYSPDRDKLIEHYYNHLKIGSKAFIYISLITYMKTVVKVGEAYVRFEKFLTEQYPSSFELVNKDKILIITRTDARELSLHLCRTNVVRSDNFEGKNISKKDKHALDMYYPKEVYFEPIPH